MRAVPPEARDLAHDLRAHLRGEVRFDGWSRSLYSTDASLYQIQPVGVVIPHDADDVQATVTLCTQRGVPLLARGGGSSLAGQAVGPAVVLDCSRRLDAVLAIDTAARTVAVQPGLTVAALNRTLAPLGLMLGPDPASAERATLGGCLANNASGSHSILYGMMADAIRAADVVLADGTRTRFAAVTPQEIDAYARRDGLEGTLYRTLPPLVRAATPEIAARWPRHWRRASGYALDRLAAPLLPPGAREHFLPGDRFRPAVADPARWHAFNLAHLLAGSEGTLALITALTLSLVPRPRHTALAVVHFDDLLAACAATTDILEVEPSACELLDRQLIELARAQPEWARRLHFVQGDPAAVLLTEFYGESPAHLDAQLERLERHLRARGHRGALLRVREAARQADVWAVRKAGLNLLMSRRGDWKPIPGIEDVTVPPEALADYLGRVLAWCGARPGVRGVAVYAHASAGCLHVRPLVNVKTAQGVATLQAMAEAALGFCMEQGGALSGEHGDGLSRGALNARLFGPQLYEALRTVKRTFDPHNLLNPGKVVDAPPLTEHLRMGADYAPIPLQTVFDWSADAGTPGANDGFAGAVEMCNGAGVCRKLGTGVMCPSFMATRDEKDSTRARANGLRNALAGRIPHEELWGPGMADLLDLCLGCKACKSECPSAVDMARLKSEFLVHHYRQEGLPLFNRLMGLLPVLNGLLERTQRALPLAVPLVNGLLGARLFRRVQAAIGIHPNRTLPRYAAQSFARRFAALPDTLPEHAPALVLFHDTWTNHNEPEVGMAAVRVLHAGGWRVHLAHGRACCGRPLLTGGQADRARPWVDHNVALLAPLAAQGIPVVGIEPSCILTLRDEYPALAADQRRALLLARHVQTFEEFVVQAAQAGRFAPRWKQAPGRALLHGHCHARALVGNGPSLDALRLAGYAVELIDSGCCGMAGDFGYERDHYAVSRAIGEDRLLPAVRAAAPDTLIVASGTSCRHQIADFTPRRALHSAEALARALA